MTTAPAARLGSISLDCRDPQVLAAFYGALLGMRQAFEAPDGHFIALTDGRVFLAVVRSDDHVPPTWPGPGKQIHLDLAVDDLDAGVAAAVGLGARLAEHQPNPEAWRVLLDPAGHPFCVTVGIPDPATLTAD